MLGNKVLASAITAVLCASTVSACAAMTESDEVVVSKQREVRKPLRVVDRNDICQEFNGRYRLVVSKIATNEPYFRFDNLSSAPIFVNFTQDGAAYRADYPVVEVLFMAAKETSWSAPMMNPGSFIGAGLKRVAVDPGAHIVFRAPVSMYLPPGAVAVKLQLRFDTLPHGTSSNACISSTPFTLNTVEK